MALWEVRVVIANGDRSWSNIFHLDTGVADDVAAASLLAIQDFFVGRTISKYIIQRIVRRPLGTADAFIEEVINVPGAVDAGLGDAMPLFNTVKVLLNGGIGRPGVKYLRGMLFGDSLSGDDSLIDAALVSVIQGAFNTMFDQFTADGISLIFGAANKVAVSAIVQNTVQMRQQHRKRRRSP